MVIAYCIILSLSLLSYQHSCNKEVERINKPRTGKQFQLDNKQLDKELIGLLREHRELSDGRSPPPPNLMVTDELEEAFAELERRQSNIKR